MASTKPDLSNAFRADAQADREANGTLPKKRKVLLRLLQFAVFITLLIFGFRSTFFDLFPARTVVSHHSSVDGSGIVFDFRDITPSTSLQWTPCFSEEFQCARLQVPMDYNRPLPLSADNPTVELAIVMLPGKDHAKTGNYSVSPLLLNPGGPGGSGTGFVLGIGPTIQQMVGEDYDIVSFDPRGIGFTSPTADCFSFPSPGETEVTEDNIAQGQFHRRLFAVSNEAVGIVNSSEIALTQTDNTYRALAKLCERKDGLKGNDSILRHVDTPNVAQDMISIIDAWDEWRDASLREEDIKAELEVHDSTKGKLVYIGFSYGTLLGATFAAMFPDRVGRVILDGVVDADHYVAPIWEDALVDTDAIFDSFFAYCAEAGPSNCSIARKGDSVVDIRKRVETDLGALQKHPLIGVNPVTNTPSLVTWSQMKAILFAFMYNPVATFPVMAQLFDLLHRGENEVLHEGFVQLHSAVQYQPYCLPHLPSSFDPGDAQLSIMCSDKRYNLNETVPLLQERFQNMSRISSFADVLMSLMIGCDGWAIEPVDPPMRWDDNPAHKSKPIKTSFPLLFLSNSYDPITPLRAAVKMAMKFKDAGLVEQKGEGHCTISVISICTIMKIRAYIRDGKVPPPPRLEPGKKLREGEWERCETDEGPWHPFNGETDWLTQDVGREGKTASQILEQEGVTVHEATKFMNSWKAIQEYLAGSENVMGRPNQVLASDVSGHGNGAADFGSAQYMPSRMRA